MYSQPMHLTCELILCIQITRGRVPFNGDSTAKSPCWHQVLNLWRSDLDLLQFAAVPSYRIWPFSWLQMVRPHSSGQYSGGPLCSNGQQAVWNTVQTFPEPVHLERVFAHLLAYMLMQRSPASISWLRGLCSTAVQSIKNLYLVSNK